MDRFKYPRTHHLPSSPGATDDDRIASAATVSALVGKQVVVTEKMDGENSTLYPDGYSHARSLDSGHHPSRSTLKQAAATIAFTFPDDYRICGENLYAKHSIGYDCLESYFQVFSIWEGDYCFDWDYTEMMVDSLNLTSVPIIWKGIFESEEQVVNIFQAYEVWTGREVEGFVVRTRAGFSIEEFPEKVLKYVRPNHVTSSSEHWSHTDVVPNRLKDY